MAINIQEILHPSDSDVIKFEKINYNFDQIVANGGGPTGPKGPAGPQLYRLIAMLVNLSAME